MSENLALLRRDGQVMTVSIRHTQPLELAALSESLQALAGVHARYAEANGLYLNGDAVRLYVREIRSGSVIVDLVEAAKNYPMFVADAGAVVSFAKQLVDIISFFRGDKKEKPDNLKKRDADQVSTFLNPVASDTGASVLVQAGDNSNVVVNLNLTSNDAAAIQKRAENWAAQQSETVRGRQFGQLLYFYQARGDAAASTGDRGIIEAISPLAVKVTFAEETAKAAILTDAIFTKAYVVDVDVQTIDGRPRLYRVLRVTDTIDRE